MYSCENKQHFGHNHALISLKLDHEEIVECKACTNPIFDEPFHGCKSCKFYLHESCINLPRSLEHPSHPSHPLTLLPSPTYSNRSYICNACGSQGKDYSFSCAHCNFDLHVRCSNISNTILIGKHPHELNLAFELFPFEDEAKADPCRLCCGALEHNRWLYHCKVCDFRAHLNCVLPKKISKEDTEKIKGKEVKARSDRSGKPNGGKMEMRREEAKKSIHQRMYEQRLARQTKIKELKAKIKELEIDTEWDAYCREFNYY